MRHAPQLPTMDTLDCIYCCNPTRSPISQSNERKAAPREIKRPHVSDLAKSLVMVPPPAIYILSKSYPCSLNVQVKLTSLTSLASVSTSALLDSRATSMFISQSFVQKHQLETTPLPQPVLVCNIDGSANENGVDGEKCRTVHYQPKQPKPLLVLNREGAGYETEADLCIKLNRQLIHTLSNMQTGCRHPNFRTKHDKT